jgi:hypothetical protein
MEVWLKSYVVNLAYQKLHYINGLKNLLLGGGFNQKETLWLKQQIILKKAIAKFLRKSKQDEFMDFIHKCQD